MSKHEFCNISIRLIPQEIIYKYKQTEKKIDGFIYVRAEKGMYGLFQASIISHKYLKENLQPLGYEPAPITTGL